MRHQISVPAMQFDHHVMIHHRTVTTGTVTPAVTYVTVIMIKENSDGRDHSDRGSPM